MQKVTKMIMGKPHVAIVITNGFGMGWSTECRNPVQAQKALFSPETVNWVLAGKPADSRPDFKLLFSDDGSGQALYFSDCGAKNLEVAWIPVGQQFVVDVYDGDEGITWLDDLQVFTA